MTEKRKVEDSELEKVTGGGGVMDPPDEQFAEVEGVPDDAKFDTHQADLSNDMILTQTDRE